MRFSKQEIGKEIASYPLKIVRGLLQWQEGQVDYTNGMVEFDVCTGAYGLNDLAFDDTLLEILPERSIPSDKRVYLTSATGYLLSGAAWTGGVCIELVDNTGALLGFAPVGGQSGIFGDSYRAAGIQLTSYNAITGVMTFPSATFTANTLAGCPFIITAGAGLGTVAGVIASNTATTITPVGGAEAIHETLDHTSYIGLELWPLSAATSTVLTFSKFTAPSVNLRDRYVSIVKGAAIQFGRIALSDTHTVTLGEAWTTVPDAGDLISIGGYPDGNSFQRTSGINNTLAARGSGVYARPGAGMDGGGPYRIRLQGIIA